MGQNGPEKNNRRLGRTFLNLGTRKGLAILGLKIPARDRLFKPDGITSIKGPMTYVLTLPVSTVIIGCKTVKQLEENVEIARAFTPMPAAEMAKLEAITEHHRPRRALVPAGAAGPAKAPEDDQNMD